MGGDRVYVKFDPNNPTNVILLYKKDSEGMEGMRVAKGKGARQKNHISLYHPGKTHKCQC